MKTIINLLLYIAFLTGSATAQDPASDDFERTSGIGSNLTIYFGGNDIDIIADSDLGITNSPTRFGIAAWTGSVFSADQYSEGVISPDKIDSMLTQVFVRRRTGDFARYGFHWGDDNTQPMWAIKYDGVPTPQTRVLDSLPDPTPPAPGDTLRIEVITDTLSGYPEIKGYHNGVLKISVIDSNAAAIMNGEPGLVYRFRINFTALWPSKAFEEWGGGSLPVTGTGIVEKRNKSSNIYPNPTTGVFTIQGATGILEVYDLFGRLVLTTTEPQTDMSRQPKGIYLVRVGEAVRKLILN